MSRPKSEMARTRRTPETIRAQIINLMIDNANREIDAVNAALITHNDKDKNLAIKHLIPMSEILTMFQKIEGKYHDQLTGEKPFTRALIGAFQDDINDVLRRLHDAALTFTAAELDTLKKEILEYVNAVLFGAMVVAKEKGRNIAVLPDGLTDKAIEKIKRDRKDTSERDSKLRAHNHRVITDSVKKISRAISAKPVSVRSASETEETKKDAERKGRSDRQQGYQSYSEDADAMRDIFGMPRGVTPPADQALSHIGGPTLTAGAGPVITSPSAEDLRRAALEREKNKGVEKKGTKEVKTSHDVLKGGATKILTPTQTPTQTKHAQQPAQLDLRDKKHVGEKKESAESGDIQKLAALEAARKKASLKPLKTDAERKDEAASRQSELEEAYTLLIYNPGLGIEFFETLDAADAAAAPAHIERLQREIELIQDTNKEIHKDLDEKIRQDMDKIFTLPTERDPVVDRLAHEKKITKEIEQLKRMKRVIDLQVTVLQGFAEEQMQKIIDASNDLLAASVDMENIPDAEKPEAEPGSRPLSDEELDRLAEYRAGARMLPGKSEPFSYSLMDIAEDKIRDEGARRKMHATKLGKGLEVTAEADLDAIEEETDADLMAIKRREAAMDIQELEMQGKEASEMQPKTAQISALIKAMDDIIKSMRHDVNRANQDSKAANRVIENVAQYHARAAKESDEAKKNAEDTIKHARDLNEIVSRAEGLRNKVEREFEAAGRGQRPGASVLDRILKIAQSGLPNLQNEQRRIADFRIRRIGALQAATDAEENARRGHIESLLREMETNISKIGFEQIAALGEAPELHTAGKTADEAERVCPNAEKEIGEVRRQANEVNRLVGTIKKEKDEITREGARMKSAMETVRLAMRRDVPDLVKVIEAQARIVHDSGNNLIPHVANAKKSHDDAIAARSKLDQAYEKAIEAQKAEYKRRAEDYLRGSADVKGSIDLDSSETDKLSVEAARLANDAAKKYMSNATKAKIEEIQGLAVKIQRTSQLVALNAANADKSLGEVRSAVSDIGVAINKKGLSVLEGIKNDCERAKRGSVAVQKQKDASGLGHKSAQEDLNALNTAIKEARRLFMEEIKRQAELDIAAANTARDAADDAFTEAKQVGDITNGACNTAQDVFGGGLYATDAVRAHLFSARQQADLALQFASEASGQAKIAFEASGRARVAGRSIDEAMVKDDLEELIAQANAAHIARGEAIAGQHGAEASLDQVRVARDNMFVFRDQAEAAYFAEVKRRIEQDALTIVKFVKDSGENERELDAIEKRVERIASHAWKYFTADTVQATRLDIIRCNEQMLAAVAEARPHFETVSTQMEKANQNLGDVAAAMASKDLIELEAIAKITDEASQAIQQAAQATRKIIVDRAYPANKRVDELFPVGQQINESRYQTFPASEAEKLAFRKLAEESRGGELTLYERQRKIDLDRYREELARRQKEKFEAYAGERKARHDERPKKR